MPYGKGTYGDKVGRPPKKKKITIISKEKRHKLKMKLRNLFKKKFKNEGVQPGVKPGTDKALKNMLNN